MEPKPFSLWAHSTAWRWLIVAACVGTALVLLAKPWRLHPAVSVDDAAQFDPSRIAGGPAPTNGSPVGGTILSPPGGGESGSATDTNSPVAGTAATPSDAGAYLPGSRSSVIWSNSSGTVSGGGLIAAYCCSGASVAVFANTPVNSGKHYWELTLSVAAGRDHPGAYTTAGVMAQPGTGGSNVDYVRSMVGAGGNGVGTAPVAINWGQSNRYRNGDVFMFALDATQRTLVYGVNGTWMNGQPGGSGVSLGTAPGSPLVAFVGLSSPIGEPEGDRWIANFGATAFRYAIPPGYVAYGAGGVASVKSPLQAAPTLSSTTGPVANGVSNSFINRTYQNEIEVGGQPIPLPDGSWYGVAFFRGAPGSGQGDTVVLVQIDSKRVVRAIAINAFKHSGNTRAGFPKYSGCDRSDYVFLEKAANEPFGKQQCWWINHDANLWREQPVFRAARSVIDGQGATAPDLMINVAVHRADDTGFVNVFHLFDPASEGIQSSASSWRDSEWSKTRIDSDPRRVAYIKTLQSWGRNWVPVIVAYRSKHSEGQPSQ